MDMAIEIEGGSYETKDGYSVLAESITFHLDRLYTLKKKVEKQFGYKTKIVSMPTGQFAVAIK